ncbi:MAG: tRNA (adenosine(37)-N6)-threonylcarbamoyltransferase complex dimerization subunit type 1 TsaB [Candidatus Saccharimonadales bacterium]
MIILTIRTDKPEAEIGLFEDGDQLVYETWQAHRQLAETIHQKLEELLAQQHRVWADVSGLVCFEGPGSFTGLRIGLTVANTLAYGLDIPIVASRGEDWVKVGLKRLEDGENDHQVMPFYGSEVHITPQKK